METAGTPSVLSDANRSYRTYEEWKLVSAQLGLEPGALFLPYLWGMETKIKGIRRIMLIGSYRTYEEWKPSRPIALIKSSAKFLPYLWGMETRIHPEISRSLQSSSYRTYEEWKLAREIVAAEDTLVLTVPMRNGNKPLRIRKKYLTAFLPYLWGMETLAKEIINLLDYSSYRTYEEWKHNKIRRNK